MSQWMIRVVKCRPMADGLYYGISLDASIFWDYATRAGALPRSSMKPYLHNDYFVNVRSDNTEVLRLIVNNIVLAESYLFEGFEFPYVLCYELTVGAKVDALTNMVVMFNIQGGQNNKADGPHKTNAGFPSRTLAVRHTLRGSGRYWPVLIKDTPKYYSQHVVQYKANGFINTDHDDDFIGLEVAFTCNGGYARKSVYYNVLSPTDYYRDRDGRLVLHRGGKLHSGRWAKYKEAMQGAYPVFAPLMLDSEGVVVEKKKVAKNAIANLATESNAQRHSHMNRGEGYVRFKINILNLIRIYTREFNVLFDKINCSGHNLNYTVEGYENTVELARLAEKIIRYIAECFPNQLIYNPPSYLGGYQKFNPSGDFMLMLGVKTEDAHQCFDYMCAYVEWMKSNYVSYDKASLGPGRGDYQPPVAFVASYLPKRPHWAFCYRDINNGNGMGEQTKWLADTAGTAGDIEQSWLTFQDNALHFIALMAHFERVCEPSPYWPRAAVKGPWPTQYPKTPAVKADARRLNKRLPAHRMVPDRTEPDPAAPLANNPMPNFAPLQSDRRAWILRCERDPAKKDDDEDDEPEEDEDEPDPEEPDDLDPEFAEAEELEEEKKGKLKKTTTNWNNEIEDLSEAEQNHERAKMYNQMIDNVALVDEVAQDALEIFGCIVAPEASPEIYEEHVASATLRKVGKKILKKMVEEAVEGAVQNWPDIPDPGVGGGGGGGTPPPARYKPPEIERDSPFTGDELPDIDDTESQGPCEFFDEFGHGPYHSYYYQAGQIADTLTMELLEPSLGRTIIETGLHLWVEHTGPCASDDGGESKPEERFKCKRVAHRLPRRTT